MQLTYQVPWERLEQGWAAIKQQYVADGGCKRGLPVLFWCGLKFQSSYFSAAQKDTNQLTAQGAGHFPDDLLAETCMRGLRALMRIYKSRSLRSLIPPRERKNFRCLEQLHFETAFAELLDRPPFMVERWLKHGNEEVNRVRFSFGMGVRSFWAHESQDLVRAFVFEKNPLHFSNSAGQPCFAEIKRVVDAFAWTAEWVLPQI